MQIDGVLIKDDGTPFTEKEYEIFFDKFIELVEENNLGFYGGSGIYTEEELDKEFSED